MSKYIRCPGCDEMLVEGVDYAAGEQMVKCPHCAEKFEFCNACEDDDGGEGA